MKVEDLFAPVRVRNHELFEWGEWSVPDGGRYREISFGLRPLGSSNRLSVYRGSSLERLGVFVEDQDVARTGAILARPVSYTFLENHGRPVMRVRRRGRGRFDIEQFGRDQCLAEVQPDRHVPRIRTWRIHTASGHPLRVEAVRGAPFVRFIREDGDVIACSTLLEVLPPRTFGLEVYRCTEEEGLMALAAFFAIEMTLKSIRRAIRDSSLTLDKVVAVGPQRTFRLSSESASSLRRPSVAWEEEN